MRADARANRDAVVDAAWALVAAEGADVPLASVAAAAGVGIGTLYRNFPTRHDLLLAVVTEAHDRVLAVVDEFGPARWSEPGAGWSRFVHELAALRLGPVISELTRSAALDPLGPDVAPVREEVLAGLGTVLDAAKDARLVRTDVDIIHFHLGIAAISRPLPTAPFPELADHPAWLSDVYVRGLRPSQP